MDDLVRLPVPEIAPESATAPEAVPPKVRLPARLMGGLIVTALELF